MKTLDEIAIEFGTDKATKHPTGAHGYTPHYDRLFSPLRKKPLRILEIGVGGGESIATWLEYFRNALVYGVDIVADTNMWNDTKGSPSERYTFTQGDQSSSAFWKEFTGKHGTFDVIIDDGGHFNDQIITTFCELWFVLNRGGLYCIEDLGVCYSPGSIFVRSGFPSHSDFLKTKLDEIMKDTHGIDWMTLSKELAVIRKRE